MALRGKPLPDQVLPFDHNLGSGLLVGEQPQRLHAATSPPSATRTAIRFEVVARRISIPSCRCSSPTARSEPVDIRTLPFIRFDDNEAHCQRFFGLNLGGFSDGGVPGYSGAEGKTIEDVDGVGPDPQHPVRDPKLPRLGHALGLPRRLSVRLRPGDGPVRLAVRPLAVA